MLGRDDDDDDDGDRDDDGEREGPRRVLPASRARSPVGTARVATEAEPRSRFVATARAPRGICLGDAALERATNSGSQPGSPS